MKIGIIGAGQIGGSLTQRLIALGHKVCVANSRGPETLKDFAKATRAKAVTVKEAVHGVDLVVVAIPEGRVTELPKNLFAGVPEKVVVVDTGNYYPRPRDGRIGEIEEGLTESRWVQRQLGRPVVKAFNTIYAKDLLRAGRPEGARDRIALPIAGDDRAAKEEVMRLVEALGFDAIDAGGLGESWRQQPGTPVYGANLDAGGVRRALTEASESRPAEFSANHDGQASHADPA